MSDKLKKLMALCKASITLSINEHKNNYMSVASYLADLMELNPGEVSNNMVQAIIAADKIIELQFYPDTPVGFYNIIDCDLDSAIDRALECVWGGE